MTMPTHLANNPPTGPRRVLPGGAAWKRGGRERPHARPRAAHVLLGLVTLLLICPAVARGQRHVGYVFKVEGQWILEGRDSRPLTAGERVPAGGIIRARNPSEFDFIVITHRNGDIMVSKECAKPRECDAPLRLPAAIKERASAGAVVFETIMGLVWGRPQRNPSGGVRGGDLQEAVVRLDGQQLDLTPVFRSPADYEFCVNLRRLRRPGAKPDDWLGPIRGGEQQAAVAARVPGIRPGLYEVVLQRIVGGECSGVDGSSWVLVTRPKDFARKRASFRRAVRLTRKWAAAPKIGPEDTRAFLQAYLEHLAGR